MNGWMIAASGGDTFFSGLLLGIVTGLVTAPILRSWLVWRGRSEVSNRADEATRRRPPSTRRSAVNGHRIPQHSPGRPTA